mgnify:CR=1 FL=1
MPGVLGIGEYLQLGAKRLNLMLVEQRNAGEVALFVEEGDLLLAEPIARAGSTAQAREELRDRPVSLGEVRHHVRAA